MDSPMTLRGGKKVEEKHVPGKNAKQSHSKSGSIRKYLLSPTNSVAAAISNMASWDKEVGVEGETRSAVELQVAPEYQTQTDLSTKQEIKTLVHQFQKNITKSMEVFEEKIGEALDKINSEINAVKSENVVFKQKITDLEQSLQFNQDQMEDQIKKWTS